MQLGELFDLSLVGRAESPALEIELPDRGLWTLTFGEISDRADQMAVALGARGVAAGDRVAMQLANGIQFIDLFVACLHDGFRELLGSTS